ncbi:S8 family peptidase [bacterium]|nr:S8 family peptidase [bacterium]
MFRKLLPFAIFIALTGLQLSSIAAELYLPGRLIVSLNFQPQILDTSDDVVLTDNPGLNDVLADCWVSDIQPLIPTWRSDKRVDNPYDLSQIYIFYFPEDMDVMQNADRLNQLPEVEYAEPDYLLPFTVTPNDTYFPNQWHLNRLQCEDGWEAFEDNSDVIIAVIDSGTEWFHPDLTDNIWVNPGEDLDGNGVVYEYDSMPGELDEIDNTDNDGNNYIDDFIGWDFVSYASGCHENEDCNGTDNDTRDYNGHGTHCAGIASAVTDNNTGVASVAWNAKIMGLRAGYQGSDGNGYVITTAAVNAVYYAVDNGAQIITMSFGGGSGSSLRTACNYAWASGLLCFHASGNDNDQIYDQSDLATGMVSVAATNSSDHKAMFSNYGTWIDVSAPGTNIMSTYPAAQGSYDNLDGTSMACPLAASVAAYIWALNPEYDNAEVRHQLLYTVDYIDGINPDYAGRLGTGRVNAYKAAYGIFTAMLAMGDIHLHDDVPGGNGDLRLMPGETAGVWTELINSWINPAYNASITLASDDPDITIPDPTYSFGEIGDFVSEDNESDPILFNIAPSAEPHYSMLTLSYRSDYSDSATYEIPVQIGAGSVLIYDFDGFNGTNDLAQYFQSGAMEAQVSADWYDIDSGDFPELNGVELSFADYEAVIFYTGENDTEVPGEVLTNLGTYLSDGGNVLFTGQHLFQNITDGGFVEEYLGCGTSGNETSLRVVYGVDGSVWEGELLLLQGTSGAGNQQIPYPTFNPTSATPIMSAGSGTEDWLCFSKTEDNWKTMFMAFSLEAAGGGGISLRIGEALSIIIYDYFGLLDNVDPPNGHSVIPQALTLHSYPNPFNPNTTLQFTLPLATEVELTVYNMVGRQVDHLATGAYSAGVHEISWNAVDHPSGVYFGVLQTNQGDRVVNKLMLIK